MATFPKCKLCGKSHLGPCRPDLVADRLSTIGSGIRPASVVQAVQALKAGDLSPRPVPPIPDVETLPRTSLADLIARLEAQDVIIAKLETRIAALEGQAIASIPSGDVAKPINDMDAMRKAARERQARRRAKAKASPAATTP